MELSIEHVAVRLGVSRQTVRRMDCDGRIPPHETRGRRIFWKSETIDAWEAAGYPRVVKPKNEVEAV